MDKNTTTETTERCNEIITLLEGMNGIEMSKVIDEFNIKVNLTNGIATIICKNALTSLF